VIGLEGTERQTPLAQPEEPGAHFFFAQFVRGTTVMRGQTTNRIQIESLGSGRQAGCSHVLDHSHTQRCHGGLLTELTDGISPELEKYPQQPCLAMIPPLRRSRSVQRGFVKGVRPFGGGAVLGLASVL
jgi:hypothetical protein